ncbi:velvet factor [Dimargaris cristalligena]|uniref:Velvet factor n=1 Tax=Dimargaris cristalligena TaxID=215637 RepID=A0A4P9ZZK8_9FUNG|nr:velvet factor [Dimargaris cristalligena]|eukprot:RKP38260.1 velvet factor [Dimargaris cristalligena]
MYVCVLSETGDEEIYHTKNGKNTILSGSLVSSVNNLRDINDQRGAFFVFPDLSIRLEGVYRLKFHLYELVDTMVYFRHCIISDPFTVYSPKRFPGMTESTELSKAFANQGLKIRVRTDLGTRK